LIYPAAGLAEVANDCGAVVIEVNPIPTALSAGFDYAIAGNAGEVLPQFLEGLRDGAGIRAFETAL
jgi:NAD-dependent deacetylase